MNTRSRITLHPAGALAPGRWPWLLLPLLVLFAAVVQGRTPVREGTEEAAALPRIQVLEGRVTSGGLQVYRVAGLKQGDQLYLAASNTAGHLDPLVALLNPGVDLEALAPEPLGRLVETLSREHDPVEVSRQVMQRYALAWNDDYAGQYRAALSAEIPADGDYWIAVGSSLLRETAGNYRLLVGIDAPRVLTGAAQASGTPFVFAARDLGALEGGIAQVNDTLDAGHAIRYYYLSGLAAGQTLYVYAEALSGDLRPVLTLYDYSDKPLAYGNFTASESRAVLQYRLPRQTEGYRIGITSQRPDGTTTAGKFRMLVGLDAPEVLQGVGDPSGQAILQEPIPVSIGVKLQQLTGVNQKSENFGVVATVVRHWRDPRLAFDPERINGRFRMLDGDAFDAEMNRLGKPWPRYTIINQQNKLWAQNRLVVLRPDGEAIYLERISTTLQAPDFDFRDFPFDTQKFYMRFDLLAPEWMFRFRELEDYSEVGGKLGEEEWVITGFDASVSTATILQRPVSQFNFEFTAKRHIEYYFFRILLPLLVIISVSWVLFFLKDYAKRVDAAAANLLLFIAFNFAISSDLPRLGYLTFLDTLLISAFLVTAVVLILSVYLRRQDMKGRSVFVARVDRYVILIYPLAYALTIATVTLLFR